MAQTDDARLKLMHDVGVELSELRQAADKLDEAVATLYGLNRTDLRCLGILYRRGRVTAGQLAEESGLSPGAITTALDRLEKGGYANRVADPEDRRRVLVISTVAAREVGARLYGEVEVASQRLLESRSSEALEAIRDYLRGTREVYEGQHHQIAAASGEGEQADAEGPQLSAPLGESGDARLEFHRGASRVTLRSDGALADLYRARFEGQTPEVTVRGNTVSIQNSRRFRPFDWRAQSSEVTLNPSIPWAIAIRGGMFTLDADLRGIRLRALEIAGGASEVEVWLPPVTGAVSVRLSGGASRVALHRPEGAAMRAYVSGGASQLVFDGQTQSLVGTKAHFETTGFSKAVDRYEVSFSGGASHISIDAV